MLTSNRAAIGKTHVRDEQNKRPFLIILNSEFTETDKALNLLLETLHRSGKVCSMVHKSLFARNLKRPLFASPEHRE